MTFDYRTSTELMFDGKSGQTVNGILRSSMLAESLGVGSDARVLRQTGSAFGRSNLIDDER